MKNRVPKIFFLLAVLFFSGAALSGFALFYSLAIEPNLIVVTRVTVDHPGLAAALGDTKIVQIADLHLEGGLGFRERSLIARINRLRPEVILATGDFVEEPSAVDLVAEFFSRLEPGLWSYGVLGNSDAHYLRGDEHVEPWRNAGLSLIGGRALRMDLSARGGRPFWLAGVDYPRRPGVPAAAEVEKVLELLPHPRPEPLIFLSYDPQLAPLLIEKGADLVLSGDTHGGQVTFPGWRRVFRGLGRSDFIRGLYPVSGAWLYVNRGIGLKHVPARFLCPPEITVFRFRG